MQNLISSFILFTYPVFTLFLHIHLLIQHFRQFLHTCCLFLHLLL